MAYRRTPDASIVRADGLISSYCRDAYISVRDRDEALNEIITDLLHWCRAEKIDFDAVVGICRENVEHEIAEAEK